MSTYTQHYSNFIGVDLSSDPRAVARNRLAYAVNMWRDYESEQGEAIETFPGFRRLVRDLGAVHGLFAYRAKSGEEYLIVHAGTRLYSFESEAVAAMDDVYLKEDAALDKVVLEDGDSQGFIFNNNLYILDGKHFVVVSSVTDQSGATSVTASEIDAYVPTTYFDGKPLEQRNMLTDDVIQRNSNGGLSETPPLQSEVYLYSSDSEISEGTTEIIGGFSKSLTEKNKYPAFVALRSEQSRIVSGAFMHNEDAKNVKAVYIGIPTHSSGNIVIERGAFYGANIEEVYLEASLVKWEEEDNLTDLLSNPLISVADDAFYLCERLKKIHINFISRKSYEENDLKFYMYFGTQSTLPEGCEISITDNWKKDEDSLGKTIFTLGYAHSNTFSNKVYLSEAITSIEEITIEDQKTYYYIIERENVEINGAQENIIRAIYFSHADIYDEIRKEYKTIRIKGNAVPMHMKTIENVKNFHDGNPDYEGTGVEAINGCTKSAVFDGRIFLTGNPALPNTVFYSNRNLTGANDPTYWGAYNYFNDGDGNTPNVDLLSTPSMLMVLKNNTVQDGSVYYHVGEFNTHEDEIIRNLVPRIYPSTSGAAGLGSAGRTVPGTTACNFLDDPVFLSTRGLEAVGKQTVNLERTITHRSSNVDRLLIKEDLSRASLAEWKGYLVICCDGRFYLADSRQIHQHADGSYQYEWYYLEGLGCYDEYSGGYRYFSGWPTVDDNGNTLDKCTLVDGSLIGEAFATSDGVFEGDTGDITVYSAQRPDGSQFYFYAHGNLALEQIDEERRGVDDFYPARKIVVVGERLFFGTDDGDICVINTDMRGVPDYKDQDFESDRISSRWYSFAGVKYPSICVTRLDDCSKKSLAKGTVPGTTVARFKMMPGSHLRINVSLNGRDFKKIGEAYASRYDAGDMRFDNFSFAENEDAIVTLRELTRNWVDKQYSFVSDGFREPFGLYEISYLYTTKGKIRRPFAL